MEAQIASAETSAFDSVQHRNMHDNKFPILYFNVATYCNL
jgi:hypothetical protein